MEDKIYPSKLLLFGEYAVVCGGEGLAIPYHKFSAKWVVNKNETSDYKIHLLNFLTYLQDNNFSKQLNLKKLEEDLRNGLDIKSNIPIGYGVGSSGAVVAAVYDSYAYEKLDEENILALKSFLGSMENYFHKKSSGLDPLVCYLQKPVHVKQNNVIEILTQTPANKNIAYVLLDTGNKRFTNTFVDIFNERMKDAEYHEMINEKYLHITSECIKQYIDNDKDFFKTLHKLSAFQLEYFNFAIPHELERIWRKCLLENNSYIKLCGAGGGGFMIQFSQV